MGLSDEEKRALEEIEKSLYADDPKFASKAAKPVPATTVVAGVLLAVIGISLMVFSAIIQMVAFGVVGFAVMLGGVLMATPARGIVDKPRGKKPGTAPKPTPPSGKSFFEDRWDRRS